MTNKKMIVAIDGPSAAGKGTLVKELAKKLDFDFLMTGNLYRYVGYKMLENKLDLKDEKQAIKFAQSVNNNELNSLALNNEHIADAASIIASYKGVREALYNYQRNFPSMTDKNGAIVEGRDIGTIIFPDAAQKFYVTASLEVRARRRYAELQNLGYKTSYEEIYQELKDRDERDEKRAIAPFKMAQDAVLIDTSNMTIQEVVFQILSYIRK